MNVKRQREMREIINAVTSTRRGKEERRKRKRKRE
jgi:hypothetical protein